MWFSSDDEAWAWRLLAVIAGAAILGFVALMCVWG
jgi:hypothetical protein